MHRWERAPRLRCASRWRCTAVHQCVSTLVELGALGVHVGVVQRQARGVAVRRGRGRGPRRVGEVRALRVVLGRVRAGVQAQVGELGGRVAALCGVVVAEILQVHEPLGPEPPADALTVHGQIDQLACRRQSDRQVSVMLLTLEPELFKSDCFLCLFCIGN